MKGPPAGQNELKGRPAGEKRMKTHQQIKCYERTKDLSTSKKILLIIAVSWFFFFIIFVFFIITFIYVLFLILRRMGKVKVKLPHFHVSDTCVSI